MSILTEAERIINGARNSDYGHAFDNFKQTAALWAPILGTAITPEQVALCMIQVKVSRLCNTTDHRDSLVDIAGYAGTYEKVLERRAELGTRNIVDEVIAAQPHEHTPHFSDTNDPGQVVPIASAIPLINPLPRPDEIDE